MHGIEVRGSGFGRRRRAVDVLSRVAAELGKRRTVKSAALLYQAGDAAQNYYLVESGMFGLFDPVKGKRRPVCFMRAGDLFSFNCGDQHALSCQAVVDSKVLSLDRAGIRRACSGDEDLARLLKSVHADELSAILRCLAPRRPDVRGWRSAKDDERALHVGIAALASIGAAEIRRPFTSAAPLTGGMAA